MKNLYELYDSVKELEKRLMDTKPDSIKSVKAILYFEDLEEDFFEDDELEFQTILINLDIRLEKENEYCQFCLAGDADGYGEADGKNKDECERALIISMKSIVNDLIDEADDFWTYSYEDKEWKPFQESIPAEYLVRDFMYNGDLSFNGKHSDPIPLDTPPLQNAFEYYKAGLYNTNDPNHTGDVQKEGSSLWNETTGSLRNWWETEGKEWYNKGTKQQKKK